MCNYSTVAGARLMIAANCWTGSVSLALVPRYGTGTACDSKVTYSLNADKEGCYPRTPFSP